MTTLPDRPATALLVVDVQNGVVRGAHRRNAMVANIRALVLYWSHQAAPGRTAGTLEAEEVDFGPAGSRIDRSVLKA